MKILFRIMKKKCCHESLNSKNINLTSNNIEKEIESNKDDFFDKVDDRVENIPKENNSGKSCKSPEPDRVSDSIAKIKKKCKKSIFDKFKI